MYSNRISFVLFVAFLALCLVTGPAGLASSQQATQVQVLPNTKLVNPVAATPISIPRPIKLEKLNRPAQVVERSNQAVMKGQILDCSFTGLTGQEMHLSVSYQASSTAQAPIYIGAWLYESRLKSGNAGYKPAQISSLPSGTVELTMVLSDASFSADYIEVFLIQNGKTFGTTQFNFPFAWTGSSGSFQIAGQAMQTEGNEPSDDKPSMQEAATKIFCTTYADAALAQYNLGKQYKLEGVVPPVWSNDHNAHFSWCLQTDQDTVKAGDMLRAQHLLNNLPTVLIKDMKTKGIQIPGINPGRGP